MCLILFACHQHPDYPLVMATNRDEFHARPTRTAQWWNDFPNLLAGKDLDAGGTWLGITHSGRIAAVTNFRDPATHNPVAKSRGELTSDFLKRNISAENYQQYLFQQRSNYNGYNLLYGSVNQLHYYSNRGDSPIMLPPGIYGLSNQLLDTPWPKVSLGKQALTNALQQNEIDPDCLWPILADPAIAPDSELPETGIGLEWERMLSSIKISGDHYGTRTSTLLLYRKDGLLQFFERTLCLKGHATEVSFNFSLQQD